MLRNGTAVGLTLALAELYKMEEVVDIQAIKTSSRLDSKQVSIVSCNPGDLNASAHGFQW
jgi:hypothetical protein